MPEPVELSNQSPYEPRVAGRSTFIDLGRVRYHVREWGDPAAPLLVMLHGWMDVAASFQFLVDYLKQSWHVIAPDWRGYGLSEWTDQGCYWLPDYLADLDAILVRYAPRQAVRLVGHSMGGNIATLYAGVRPERIHWLVNLEGLGMAGDPADRAPRRLAKWLEEMRDPPTLRPYPSLEAVARRLQLTNKRLPGDRALYLAAHWSRRRADGQFEILGDPAHKIVNPYLYRAEETTSTWREIKAPVLWVMARESEYAKKMDAVPGYGERIASIARVRRLWVEAAGHMMHHDQPELLAGLIEAFELEHAAASGDLAEPAR
jgi:pimeloyl-ACP methyl ester carboxylesterase